MTKRTVTMKTCRRFFVQVLRVQLIVSIYDNSWAQQTERATAKNKGITGTGDVNNSTVFIVSRARNELKISSFVCSFLTTALRKSHFIADLSSARNCLTTRRIVKESTQQHCMRRNYRGDGKWTCDNNAMKSSKRSVIACGQESKFFMLNSCWTYEWLVERDEI